MFNAESKAFQFAKFFLPAFIVLTAASGLIYLTNQQNYRQNANDPQIQIAEDTRSKLEKGAPVESIIPSNTVEIDKSLSPFVIIYNQNYEVVASSALLNGEAPVLPKSVLKNLPTNKEWRQTWQPQDGVRIATVVTRFSNSSGAGFVLAGRSLKEVETRIDQLTAFTFFVWIFGTIILFIFGLIFASGKIRIIK